MYKINFEFCHLDFVENVGDSFPRVGDLMKLRESLSLSLSHTHTHTHTHTDTHTHAHTHAHTRTHARMQLCCRLNISVIQTPTDITTIERTWLLPGYLNVNGCYKNYYNSRSFGWL